MVNGQLGGGDWSLVICHLLLVNGVGRHSRMKRSGRMSFRRQKRLRRVPLLLVVVGAWRSPRAGGLAPPDGWRFYSVREETAPRAEVLRDKSGEGYGLLLSG